MKIGVRNIKKIEELYFNDRYNWSIDYLEKYDMNGSFDHMDKQLSDIHNKLHKYILYMYHSKKNKN